MMNAQDMMVNALQNGQGQMPPPPDQAMNPMGMQQGQPNPFGGANPAGGSNPTGGMLGNAGLLQMLTGGGGNGLADLLKTIQQKQGSDGNPDSAPGTSSPGTFTPGGQASPTSPSVTPF